MLSFKKAAATLFAAFVVCGTLSAAPWAALGSKRVPETLVIVSNYQSPRLMAELIQNESRAPYILLPTNESGDGRIVVCPPKQKSIQIREARFNTFVRFLNPKRIVVIGNDRYVNKRYVDMLDRTIPVVRIDSADWGRMAEALNFLLNLSHLDKNFKRLSEQLAKNYRPVSLPDKAPAANTVPPAENKPQKTEEAAPAGDKAEPVEEVKPAA